MATYVESSVIGNILLEGREELRQSLLGQELVSSALTMAETRRAIIRAGFPSQDPRRRPLTSAEVQEKLLELDDLLAEIEFFPLRRKS